MDNFRLSERLKKVAGLIHKGNTVADIGTDHGYLPIYIIKQHISGHVIGMDLRKGPLDKARQNIKLYNAGGNTVEDYVELRLSDGLDKLKPHEADTITICGMGGKLIQRILINGRDKFDSDTQIIVSPQSELEEFRQFLDNEGYITDAEYMLMEEGQYYLIIECHIAGNLSDNAVLQKNNNLCDETDIIKKKTYYRFGKELLNAQDRCLYEYLKREQKINKNVYDTVNSLEANEGVRQRLLQLEEDKKCIEYALSFYQ